MKNTTRFLSLLLALLFVLTFAPAMAEEDIVTYTGFGIYKDDENHTIEDSFVFKDTLEKSGINLEIDYYSSTVAAEKRSLLLGSGDYPDIFFCEVDVEWYGAQEGILLPLEELIKEYAPNMAAYIDSQNAWDYLTCTDGHVYGFPTFGVQNARDGVLWINRTWLENLDLEMPTSFDELYDVLVAFKEYDANGNGDASDEIPFLSYEVSNGANFIELFNYCEWMFNYEFRTVVDEDGTCRMLPMTEEFKSLIEYLTTLYQEGLLNEDCFTLTSESAAALVKTTDTVGMFIATSPTNLCSREDALNWAVVEPWSNSVEVSNGIYRLGMCITNKCENPEKFVQWLDYLFTEEGSIHSRLGIQGKTYEIDENGNYYWLESEEQTMSDIQNILCYKGIGYITDFELFNDAGSDKVQSYIDQQRRIAANHAGLMMFELAFTEDQLTVGLPIMIDMNTAYPQYMAKVMTGEYDLESSWVEFQQQLNDMQVPVLEEIIQDCYDRMEK